MNETFVDRFVLSSHTIYTFDKTINIKHDNVPTSDNIKVDFTGTKFKTTL